jgi:hypothetical protein
MIHRAHLEGTDPGPRAWYGHVSDATDRGTHGTHAHLAAGP